MLQHISIENAKRILHAQGSVQDAALASGLSGTGRLQALFPNAELRNAATPMHAQALHALQHPPQQPIALHIKGTPFQLKVWQALLNIRGQPADYGTLARRIGHPNACRAVGTAVGSNPVAVLIPCHRVIRQTGMIGGYRWHRGRKIALLGKELESA